MKIVTLLRHAKSSWNDDTLRDIDRPLNERGRRAAALIGAHMAGLGMKWDAVAASPAVRVAETIAGFEQGYGAALPAETDRRIYLADAETLLEVVQSAAPDTETLLIVGHNPGMEDLVFLLTPADGSENRRAVDVKYPTATVCQMRFDVDGWDEVAPGGGEIMLFVRPRDLDAGLGPEG